MDDELRRCLARHIAIPEIGVAGQEAMLATRALLDGTSDVTLLATTYLIAGGAGAVTIRDGGVHSGPMTGRLLPPTSPRVVVQVPDRPDWWPAADGDETALVYWRAGTAAATWMLDVARRR